MCVSEMCSCCWGSKCLEWLSQKFKRVALLLVWLVKWSKGNFWTVHFCIISVWALVISCSVPAKILASHLVKLEIERSVEVSEPEQDLRGDLGVGPALWLPQAPWPAAPLGLLQTREAFGLIKVEVLVSDYTLESEEVLNPTHLPSWIRHKALAADKKEAWQREKVQPVFQVLSIDANAHRTPRRVNQACAGVMKHQVLKGREPRRLG